MTFPKRFGGGHFFGETQVSMFLGLTAQLRRNVVVCPKRHVLFTAFKRGRYGVRCLFYQHQRCHCIWTPPDGFSWRSDSVFLSSNNAIAWVCSGHHKVRETAELEKAAPLFLSQNFSGPFVELRKLFCSIIYVGAVVNLQSSR